MEPKPSENFRQWIEKAIDDPGFGNRLPTVRALSRSFGLSPSTIQKKLRPYIEDNTLTAIRGRGLFVTSRMPQSEVPSGTPSIAPAQSIEEALTEDIATGRLKHGDPLPPVKFVCRQFKTGQSSVTRAYRMLQKRGLARRVGRRFWVGGLQPLHSFGSRGTVVCFNFSEGDVSDLTVNAEFRGAFEAMEHELHNHRLSIRFRDPAELDMVLRPETFLKGDFQSIVISSVLEEKYEELSPRLEALEPTLTRSGKRILLCGGHYTLERGLYTVPKKLHFFCHGTIITNVVRTAAEYAFMKGFDKAVLLFHETENSGTDLRFYLRFISELRVRNPRADIRLCVQPLYRDSSPEEIFKRTSSYTIHKDFYYLEGLLSKYEPYTMRDLEKIMVVGDTMEELMRQAPRGAVWVTKDAATACRALRWCMTQRISLPSDAAILCFDGDASLHYRGIASCVPDLQTIGYLMAHALIGDIPLKRSRKGFLPTPAVLYERETMP